MIFVLGPPLPELPRRRVQIVSFLWRSGGAGRFWPGSREQIYCFNLHVCRQRSLRGIPHQHQGKTMGYEFPILFYMFFSFSSGGLRANATANPWQAPPSENRSPGRGKGFDFMWRTLACGRRCWAGPWKPPSPLRSFLETNFGESDWPFPSGKPSS